MKKLLEERIKIPQDVSCEVEGKKLICRKGPVELSKVLSSPKISLSIDQGSVLIKCEKSSKSEKKIVHSFIKHIESLFQGLNEKYIYTLEACNVHFPMSIKIEPGKLMISNFLGEKIPRIARILPNVDVSLKGQIITVTSADRESAGQTAGNIETATKVKSRDRRVFQDGIYITKKPGDKKHD